MDMCSIVTAFEAKLEVFAVDVTGKKTFSPHLASHSTSSNKRHVEVIETLADFRRRFSDFKKLTPLFKFVYDPFVGDTESTKDELSCVIDDNDILQVVLEICELKENLQLQ